MLINLLPSFSLRLPHIPLLAPAGPVYLGNPGAADLKPSRYSCADLREIRRSGQARECARRRRHAERINRKAEG